MEKHLIKFITAQEKSYETALSEIKSGRKKSHWMWYIFPQIKGLGFSETSKYYEITSMAEARNYLDHPVLGKRLLEITRELLNLQDNNPTKILGHPDDLKLKSSMTLFSVIDQSQDQIFKQVLNKFYNGESDAQTLAILNNTEKDH